MKLGTVDFLQKPFTPEALTKRGAPNPPELCRHRGTVHRHTIREKIAGLSPRERELLDAIVGGNSTKMVADRLQISVRTVDHHRASLMDKMQACNVADLVRMAVEADYPKVTSGGGPSAGH